MPWYKRKCFPKEGRPIDSGDHSPYGNEDGIALEVRRCREEDVLFSPFLVEDARGMRYTSVCRLDAIIPKAG